MGQSDGTNAKCSCVAETKTSGMGDTEVRNERVIQLGSDLIAISVQDDVGALAQAKNGRRSTMSRSRAAAASPLAPPAGP